MVRHIIPIALLLLAVAVHAQRPMEINIQGKLGSPELAKTLCPNNNAGTIRFGAHRGQSNDVTPDTIFLCFGDELDIIHNRDAVLNGDPIPATPAGVGYGFYACRPTVMGPTAAAVRADPCQVNTPPPPSGLFYVAPGQNLQGDITFVNDGFLQMAFNNGNPRLWWFAPITYDRLNGNNAEYEGSPAGPCVSVSTNAAFAVVYLNAIQATDINPNASASGCMGTFRVRGGLPEFDPLRRYQIDITLNSNPAVKGRIGTAPRNGDEVEFFVPQSGVYTVTVRDGKSCSTSFEVAMNSCTAVTFSLPAATTLPGENICVPVTVENFNNIQSIQLSIQWDPSVLQFLNVGAFNLPDLDGGSFNPIPLNGQLTMSWLNLMGITRPDSSRIFEICFRAVGPLGSRSLLRFVNEPTNIEIVNGNTEEVGFIGRNGIIALTSNTLIPLLVQDSVSCPGSTDGAFSLTMFGGTPPYSFTWRAITPAGPVNGPFTINNAGVAFRVENLAAGRYEITARDSETPVNTVTDTIEVFRAPLIGLSLVPTPPRCFGANDGSVRAVVDEEGVELSNPENRFTFVWNVATPSNTSQLNGLPFGPYSVTITDAKGCNYPPASLNLSQPPRLLATEVITNATCSGSENGSVVVTASGGRSASGNYTFQWSHVAGPVIASVSRFDNLNPGQYTVTLTDDNNCEVIETYNVGAVKTLSIQRLALENVTCHGDSDGRISVRGSTIPANSEALPYTFNWTGPNLPAPNNTNNTSELNGLGAGTFILTMSDSDPQGCRVVDTFLINEPPPLAIVLADLQNETCVVGNDGRASVTVTGGVLPYAYRWNDPQNQTDSIAVNLRAGDYTIEVTDGNGCSLPLDITISAPTPPTIQPLADDAVSCPNSTDGTLTASAIPVSGTTITSYQWSNGASGQTISGLSPGTYIVTVTASDGCTNTAQAQITSPDPVQIDSIVAISPTCVGFDNGRLTVFASGGTAPYRYIWANTPQNDTLTANVYGQLKAGTYQVTVVDANNCTPATISATVTDPPAIEIMFSDIVGTSCAENTCDGSARASAQYSNGTTALFTYSWQSGEVQTGVANSLATQLCAGNQVVVATDANNCFGIDTVNIPSPPVILIQVDAVPVSCNGLSDGAITLTPSGGTPGFTFQWQGRTETTGALTNLTAGVYNAIITDANGCAKTQLVQLTEPDELQLTIDVANTTPSVSCSGDNDGRISVVFNANANINPVGPAPFTWSNNAAPANASIARMLAPGTYSVTITDVKGCTDTLSYTILEPQPIVANIRQPADPRCFGESTLLVIDTVFGGVGSNLFDYTYQINNSGVRFAVNQPTSVFAGAIVVTIEDPAGCRLEQTLTVNQPAPIEVIFDPAVVEVELGDSTQLLPIVISSLGIASFAWSPNTALSAPNVESPFVKPLQSNKYTLVVTDVNGCKGQGMVMVEVDYNRNVYIPNAFSPNGDGPNDDFRIFTCNGVRGIASARIFDRWGNLMFSRETLQPECNGVRLWDGRLNNKLANPGVYVYIIEVEFIDNIRLIYRGDVTLLR